MERKVAFQRCVYEACYWLAGPFVKLYYNFRPAPCKVKSPVFLALGNHTRNLDPALLVIGLRRHMRFVANASLTKGVAGLFLNNLFGIIPREKGAKGDAVIALIEKSLKDGVSVGMFPEGNRSWDGETEFISRRTALLAKESGAALVTYRFRGGYLKRPRWADTRRSGHMTGELVREYSPQELAAMTEDQVYEAICRDLYVNAYEDQKTSGELFRGRRLAEGLEYAAYLCPGCHRFGTVVTKGDTLKCSCGIHSVYTETGSFAGGNLPFSNFAEWNRYQKKWMHDNAGRLRTVTDTPVASDAGFRLTVVRNGKQTELSDNASIAVYGDRIVLGTGKEELTYGMDEIRGFGTFLSRSMYFNTSDSRYLMVFRDRVSTLKYYALWRVLSGREYR